MTDATPPPAGSPDYWQAETLRLSSDLEAIAQAFHDLAERLPRAIQQAADLGLMREQHDMAGVRTALLGEQTMNVERDEAQAGDHAGLVRLEGQLTLLTAAVHRLEQTVTINARCAGCPDNEVGT